MKQVIQSLATGEIIVEDVPCVNLASCSLLIQTRKSLISSGTEKSLLSFGQSNIIKKAIDRKEDVKKVIDKMKSDGIATTLKAVNERLGQPMTPGYCNVGKVLEVGHNVSGFSVGDRVISNGSHAEIVCVKKHLCAKIPDNVSDQTASFTVLGAIALQGVRLAQPTLGECFVVMGLGLVGLLAVQLLKAQGCRVLGMDFNPERLRLAESYGAEVLNLSASANPESVVQQFSRGNGCDAVIITASTKSNDPIDLAPKICRKRGRIILVGVVGLNLSRKEFYEKEISFQVSCSYGPGRYDDLYEGKGQDYPIGFVRWTEQRNFEAVLDMMSEGKINVERMISHEFDIADAQHAYEHLSNDKAALGLLLNYPEVSDRDKSKKVVDLGVAHKAVSPELCRVSFVGAGNYATRVLMPAFKKAEVSLATVVTNQGVSGTYFGRRFGFHQSSTDFEQCVDDESTDAVVVVTRHNMHADQVIALLKSGKHVFVEKPVAMGFESLNAIRKLYSENLTDRFLMVGFNRRYSPYIQKLKSVISHISSPKAFVYTVNAGALPQDHWLNDPSVGGGRLIGEACHFVDLLRFLAGHHIVSSDVIASDSGAKDTFSIQLKFSDGSIGLIHYFANGHASYQKERVEVFSDGAIYQVNNFKSLYGYGDKTIKRMRSFKQKKGVDECVSAFVSSVKTGNANGLIPLDEIFEVAEVCINLNKKLMPK